MGSDKVLKKIVQVFALSLLALPNLSLCLFEKCDENYSLDTDNNITITSLSTLNAKNVSSCRYTLTAPASYIIRISCELKFDQPDSSYCRTKRFFVSIDGIITLNHAHNFCNKNGTIRIIKRRSVMNRLVMAYVSKRDIEDETFTCTAWRVKSKCECGWSRRVRIVLVSKFSFYYNFMSSPHSFIHSFNHSLHFNLTILIFQYKSIFRREFTME